jgi:phosphotransferase system HPr (HPr) family protein
LGHAVSELAARCEEVGMNALKTDETASSSGPKTATAVLTLRNKSGLHGRPAGAFVRVAKAFRSDIHVNYRDKKANGKSILSLIQLDAWQHAFISLSATGEDAAAAMDALRDLIRTNFGEPE